MGRYSEEQFQNLCKDVSKTENDKIKNAIFMVNDAVKRNNELRNLDIEVFVQGSYANNTNVKAESDVDVCVMLKSTFYYGCPDGLTNEDYGFPLAYDFDYNRYKQNVIEALKAKFGPNDIKIGNKAVNIKSNTYRVEADVVIALQYRNYRAINSKEYNRYIEGTKFISSSGDIVINYPKIHIENGNLKDEETYGLYKNLVRIFKNIKNDMTDERIITGDKITSFLIESLIYNVPNDVINYFSINYYTWYQMVKEVTRYLYNKMNKEVKYGKFLEVSKRYYLFRSKRKWTEYDVRDFLVQIWNYIK
jgi:hypothetical protein